MVRHHRLTLTARIKRCLVSKVSRVSSKSQKSKSKEEPQSNNQSIEERVMIMMKKKLAKQKRLRKEEFVEQYVRMSILADGKEPPKDDIESAYIQEKNSGKKKRVKPKSEPELSKAEFVERHIHNSRFNAYDPNIEKEANRWWDLEQLDRKCKALRSKKKREAFRECAAQVIKDRYSPAKIEERRLQREMEMNKHNIT